MKNVLNIVFICMAVLSACTNKEEPTDDGSGNKDNDYDGIYTVQLPSSTKNGKSTWIPGDKLVVHGEYSKDQITVTLEPEDISADGKTCSINVKGVAPYEQKASKAKYFIAYPGDMVINDAHCKDMSQFNGTNALLMAGYNKDKTFVMESLVGGFTFTVDGDFDSYALKGNNDETVGYNSLSCRITETSKIYAQSKGAAQASVNGLVIADGKSVNHVSFSGNVNFADGFIMIFYKNGTPVKTFYVEDSYDVSRNVFMSLGDITSNLIAYKAPAVDTHVSAIPKESAVDLGSVETANCYIVNEPGIYSFKAVKGNSSEPLASIGSVEILWESWGTMEDVVPNSVIAQVDFEKDMVYFRIAENCHPGNAIIAARNDMGVIIWSWHIWVPETPIAEGLYGLSRHMTMDRNLGAIVAASADGASPKSAGLFYQWGRKDPFVGVGDFSIGEPASVAGQKMTLAGGQMTTSQSVKNPTMFADYDGHWNEAVHDGYWDISKSKSDPCPPGYRVPYRSEYILFTNNPEEINGWEYSPLKNMFSIGNPATTYPLGGYITVAGEYAQSGEGIRVWSSRNHDTAGYAYNFRIFEDGGASSYGNGGKPKANGFAVRCVSYVETPFENVSGTPVKSSYKKYNVNVTELSGLCLHTDNSFLWGVGDQGTLAKINFDGSSEKILSVAGDLESVTVSPKTGDLYFGCESHYISKSKAPDYKSITQVFTIPEAADYGNSGVEGISWYKDDMLLIGTQTGAYLWAYKYDGIDENGKERWTKVWRKSMRAVAIGMQEIADICYDPVKDQIWIIDSETQCIYLFNGDATEHLATYPVSFGGNCESVYLDYNNSCVWIADDDTSSRLFKIDFTF